MMIAQRAVELITGQSR